MRRIAIPGAGLDVSALCFGAGALGTHVRGPEADRLVGAFLDAGGDFFDTAHCYACWLPDGLGASERELAACLRCLGALDGVTIATKGGHPAIGECYPRPDRYLSPEVIAADLDDSLARMGLDRVPLYYLHRDDPRVPVAEIMDALNAEADQGRISCLGASNWSVARIAEANAYAARRGRRGFAASQVQWSLPVPTWPVGDDPTMRTVTDEDAAWYEGSGMAVVAYSATANGYLAGSGKGGAAFESPENQARRERATRLAAEMGCTPTQVGLAYLLCQAFPVVPLFSTGHIEHIQEAIGALGVPLTPEQIRWLRDG